ncbi:MAG TPA: glycosyltransferase [Bacteroidota bacterium]|nr:glycosyltransferase [Bacteroidota bacterium]
MIPYPPRIALVHDWLVGMRGGERVLEVLCELFPGADLFTLVHARGSVSPIIEKRMIRTSFIQRLPMGRSRYQYYLPLFPLAARSLDVRKYDLVISSSSSAAKAVEVGQEALHICYCHTPMRYLWDQYDQYFGKGRSSPAVRTVMRLVRGYLRRWDVSSSGRVHHFIANSRFIQERIRRIYGRESEIIYPPVDVDRFTVSRNDDGYFLIVSALVPYKRIDLAVRAFNARRERLLIIGSGGEQHRLKAMAGPTIEFLGPLSDDLVRHHYERCRGVVFPGEEDFGIVPVEAMACGKPVIAYGRGGVRETVVDPATGTFFEEQSSSSLERAIGRFHTITFDAGRIRAHVEQFRKEVFRSGISSSIRTKWESHVASGRKHP